MGFPMLVLSCLGDIAPQGRPRRAQKVQSIAALPFAFYCSH
jgi:hypothetical protein